MSEIPFIAELGDALEHAIALTSARRRRRRLFGRPARLAMAFAVLAAGAAVAAQTLLSSPVQRAAINGIGCYDGTGTGSDGAFDIYGPSPIAACRRAYAAEHSPLARPGAKLVACVGGQGPIAMVFAADAQPADQCSRLGFRPLPHGYAPAASSVATLDREIVAAWRSRDCIAPAALAQRIDAVLARLGWTGWRAQLQPNALGAEPCGNVGFDGNGQPDPSGALNAAARTVTVFSGPSISMTDLSMRMNERLVTVSGAGCLTLQRARADAEAMIPTRLRPAIFTVTREPSQGGFGDSRQARYEAGCTIVVDAGASADGRSVDVALENRSAAAAGPDGKGAPVGAGASVPAPRARSPRARR
jgi:hypothetical protein